MKITFIANACAVFEEDGFRLLSDPWLIDGAFEGSWCHYPPLKTKPEDLVSVDAIYLSHIHPDHYDRETLKYFRKDIPIIVLKTRNKFFKNKLEQEGFTNLIEVGDFESVQIGPFKYTLFAPFDKHYLYESSVGNLIDSAILIEADSESVLNVNDNIPSIKAATQLRDSLNLELDALLAPHSSAGPYPSCFNNLTKEEKLVASNKLIEKSINHLVELWKIFRPRFLIPFAGDFYLGGKELYKNEFLGNSTPQYAESRMKELQVPLPTMALSEGDTVSLTEGIILSSKLAESPKYPLLDKIVNIKYPYEYDEMSHVDFFTEPLPQARWNVWKWQEHFKFKHPLTLSIKLGENNYFSFRFDSKGLWFDRERRAEEPYLECEMDLRLLKRILLREAHWNNAEVGCHINFYRKPDVYVPDVHTMMSFFHLP